MRGTLDVWADGGEAFMETVHRLLDQVLQLPDIPLPLAMHSSGLDYWRGTEVGRCLVYDRPWSDILACSWRPNGCEGWVGYALFAKGRLIITGSSRVESLHGQATGSIGKSKTCRII